MAAHAEITLAIETSNPAASPGDAGSVALGRAERWSSAGAAFEVLGAETLQPGSRHDDALAPAIDRLCRRAGVRPADLARIAVSTGPGGYSALRIAIAAAKMIAEATGAATIPVESAAVGARAVEIDGLFAVLLASKGDTCWATCFARAGGALRLEAPGRLVDADRLDSLGPVVAMVGDEHLPAAVRVFAAERTIPVLPLRLRAEHVLGASVGLEAIDPVALQPMYPREPEAVTRWRELGRERPARGSSGRRYP